MPCYIVQKTSVKFNAKYKEILEAALKRAGIQIMKYSDAEWIVTQGGRMSFSIMWKRGEILVNAKDQERLQPLINKVKQEYSKQVLLVVARAKKWNMNPVKGKADTFELQR